ncbi:MAG: zinc-ribbon domain-containing protein [Thermoproteota archaeon]|nr:CdvA-like protein [Candidatus Brockarchaeota archaeon]MBO3768404.1 CdvA-like protein [Candidatus Brockarchaeota archaeon]
MEYLTDEEFKHEIELFSTQLQRVRQQIERLVALKNEGKVSDQVFREVLEEIANKVNAYSNKYNEIEEAVATKQTKIKDESKELKHYLETLEVKYTIGAVPEDQYKVNRASYTMRFQNLDEFSRTITSFMNNIRENWNKITSYINQLKPVSKEEEMPVTQSPITTPSPIYEAKTEEKPVVQLTKTQAVSTPITPPTTSTPEQKKKEKKICPKCGAENPADATFCYNCGAKLA